jgi:glycerol uptake facilitator-like aquaporin
MLLATAVIGSGVMAQRLTGDGAVALLANTLATVAALAVLIGVLAPISGAYFNPAATHARAGLGQFLSETVATAGLITVALSCATSTQAAWRVPAWIGAAYWFTASTSFANPAITLARALSDTFAGIRPVDIPGFIAAQILGALAGLALTRWLFGSGAIRSADVKTAVE